MDAWLKDLKDSDRVALLLLFIGLGVMGLSCVFTVFIVFHIKEETILDRVLVAIAALSAQGGGLITAAMGLLRLQSRAESPAPTQIAKTETTTSVTQTTPEAPKSDG